MVNARGLSDKTSTLINLIKSQFEARTIIQAKRSGADFKDVVLTHEVKDKTLYFTLTTRDETHTISVPLPYHKSGVTLIKCNEVERAICDYFNAPIDRIISYLDVIHNIFIGDYSGIITTVPVKKTIFIQQLAYAVLNNNLSVIVYNLQKAINEVVNKMPLHETVMNSWMMNNRLMIIDPAFDSIIDPTERLAYQVNKNKRYFNRGWTSIGLSDGSLADKNYILTKDIRKCTPFGLNHHNPQRNLYSTLGMKGDEFQRIRTKTTQKLMKQGITRKGWNWFTAYVDLPDTFEDQIVIDKSHAGKFVLSERRFQCFGEVMVKEGQKLKVGTPLVRCDDGEIETYKVKADEAWVDRIVKDTTTVGGQKKHVYNVVVKFKRKLKDGTKITNTHGNKGIVRLFDLGYAIDPVTAQKRKLDTIVSAKTVPKRKNHGQILEALYNEWYDRTAANTVPEVKTHSKWVSGTFDSGFAVTSKATAPVKIPIVLADELVVNVEGLKSALIDLGFNKDLTWECDTYAGKVSAVCGTVFWGVSKDVEDQLWDFDDTIRTNGRDLRTAGLKFSTVEFKALETIFGKDNAVLREVLSYTQGIENVEEELKMLRSKTGQIPEGLKVKSVFEMKEIDQSMGTMFPKEMLLDTLADEFFASKGMVLQLPIKYQTAVGINRDDNYEGGVVLFEGQYDKSKYKAIYLTDKLYIPAGVLRRSWRHSTGLYGMSEVAVLLNNIVALSNRYREEPENVHRITMLYRSIANYFAKVALMLGTKRGDISNYTMSVRYPFSAKAVASLSNSLPPNTIQIHKDMATILKVTNGDVVLTERFPCLGFMGVRPQKVLISNNPMCKYTIRVSGNSLVSQNLDFDGDVLYVASFHSKEAKEALNKEWTNPNEACWKYTDWLNNRKGVPSIHCFNIDDYKIIPFTAMTNEEHAQIVGKLTGVKAQTGPVIAMAYNLMRITENSGHDIPREIEAGIEMFIEKAGQSVFEQKHGGQSLHDIVIDAICSGDLEILIEEGFDPEISRFICEIIASKAAKLGVYDLKTYHDKQKLVGGSTIINRIIRVENKIYFASRSALEGINLLEHLDSNEVDLPSRIFKLTTSGKYNGCRTFLDDFRDDKLLKSIKDEVLKEACSTLFKHLDITLGARKIPTTKNWPIEWRKSLWQLI